MIYRKSTRVVRKNNTGATATEISQYTRDVDSAVVPIPLETTGFLYLGYHEPFTTRYFAMGTANAQTGDLTVEFYKNSTTWEAVEDLVDLTAHFTQSGFLSWQNPGTWQNHKMSPISDVELYWLRISVGANLDAGTTLKAIVNMFCDENDVNDLYPHLIQDSNWLPSGVTSRLPLLHRAKDEVVRRLKKSHVITDESMILDINEVSTACVHAYAYLAYLPRAHSSEEAMERMKTAKDAMKDALSQVTLSMDVDNSGTIDDDEADVPGIRFSPR